MRIHIRGCGRVGVVTTAWLAAWTLLVSAVCPPPPTIGINRTQSGIDPPDVSIAASPGHVIEVVNDRMRIMARSSGLPIVAEFQASGLFGCKCPTVCTQGCSAGDCSSAIHRHPRVHYDPASGRFYFMMAWIPTGGAGKWCFATSLPSNQPNYFNSWVPYRFDIPGTSDYADHPGLGVTGNKIILTGDVLFGSSGYGTAVRVISKSDIDNGRNTINTAGFAPPTGSDRLFWPALNLSSDINKGFDVGNGTPETDIRVREYTGEPGVGTGVARQAKSDTLATPWTFPPAAPQAGTSTQIDTGDARFQSVAYKDGYLWATWTVGCTPVGDSVQRSCGRFTLVQNIASTFNPMVTQDVFVAAPGVYYYYPAATIDQNGNLLAIVGRSNGAEYAALYSTGRLAGDVPNALHAPLLLKGGEAPYAITGFFGAPWGEDFAAERDPNSGTSVWLAGEYAASPANTWGTAIFNGSTANLLQ